MPPAARPVPTLYTVPRRLGGAAFLQMLSALFIVPL
jgi:hypothetical protein